MTALETVSGVIARSAEWVRLGLEAVGAVVIAVGATMTLTYIARTAHACERVSFTAARLVLARYLTLALEFQLAADVLETAVAPEWRKLGQLAAIAAIRTALNYFLSREMREEREQVTQPLVRGGSQP
jgi:uncharacterized membrane protein